MHHTALTTGIHAACPLTCSPAINDSSVPNTTTTAAVVGSRAAAGRRSSHPPPRGGGGGGAAARGGAREPLAPRWAGAAALAAGCPGGRVEHPQRHPGR